MGMIRGSSGLIYGMAWQGMAWHRCVIHRRLDVTEMGK